MARRALKKNAFGLYEKRFQIMQGQPSKENAVAYCHNKSHKGLLTVKMMKNHECLRKQCPFLEKYEDRPYWEERILKKQKKKLQKGTV